MNFIESHIQMLDDPMITVHMEDKIRQMMKNTESVFHTVIGDYKKLFTQKADSFFQQRLVDVSDISQRILGHLNDKGTKSYNIPPGSIVFSKEIAPSHIAGAHSSEVYAVCSENGGGNSHTALIARSKAMPYVASIDIEKVQALSAEVVIVDGSTGTIILNPAEETLRTYREKQKQALTRYQLLEEESRLSSETIDGFAVHLFANVGNKEDLEIFPDSFEGVGLFRTEYLFLHDRNVFPSEKRQRIAYRDLFEKAAPKPVVIRVFDLGGDKVPSLFAQGEPNPVLGCRGVRFLLRHREIFRQQLRAIFMAAEGFEVKLLIPLICDVDEIKQVKELVKEVEQELSLPPLPLGCMIEVPSAALICDMLADYVDFFSIGTNDLVQYTLGVDRSNPAMSDLFYPAHPSVLRFIRMVCLESQKKGIPVSICGEIASNPLFAPLLLGLGLSEFSCSPRYLPSVKQMVRKWKITDAYRLADEVLRCATQEEVLALLRKSQL
jgi:phosphotransferase system enzyme I (PtsI)